MGRRKNNRTRVYIIIVALAFGCYMLANKMLAGRGNDTDKITTTYSGNTCYYKDLYKDVVNHPAKSKTYDYTGFSLAFNPENHTPDWVGWELLSCETDGSAARNGKRFWKDDKIKGCAKHNDYTHSGYDRGHMFPAADAKWNENAMNDCFTMANICPQNNSLNSGAWSTLEEKERLWANRDSALIIIAGPIYKNSDTKTIGEIGVRVPSAFFKVLIAPYLNEPRGIAFVYPNMYSPGNMQNYSTTIDEVEKITGLDFFSSLPDNLEDKLESKASFKLWNKQN